MITSIKDILNRYSGLEQYSRFMDCIQNEDSARIRLSGLAGSAPVLVSSALIPNMQGIHFFLMPDREEAAYFYNDLLTCLDPALVAFLPSSYKRSIQYGQKDKGNIILRTEALNLLNAYSEGILVLVSYPEALIEQVVTKKKLDAETFKVTKGERVTIQFVREIMAGFEFEEVDFVTEPGQFAVRGSIVDIFSFSAEYPYRLDFFGDEIESIRSFDVENQLSVKHFNEISVLPDVFHSASGSDFVPAIRFHDTHRYIWSSDLQYFADRLDEIYQAAIDEKLAGDQLYTRNAFWADLSGLTTIEIGNKSVFPGCTELAFSTKPQPLFQKNFTLLGDNLKMHLAKDYEAIVLSENDNQLKRLQAIFRDTHQGIPFTGVPETLYQGFIDHSLKICCYTDHQIFDRYHKYKLHHYYSSKATLSLNELKSLKPGDYVVHIDHGVGRFGGLEKVTTNGKTQEAVKLVYRDNDVLYVNIHSLHRISKYKGKDSGEPKIYKLGAGAWKKLKDSTKKKVKDIAKDLIALYAQRKAKEGFRFSGDTYLQEELEASFLYEDTADQVTTTKAVKADMESKIPMDRLICGDVGFGKTEIAIRAAFKAVADSKQVALLVPTTILALQHATTFRERLRNFPCRIEYISRLVKPARQKEILNDVESGTVDILIGTHRLLSKDIKFRDLGLLIIDEEQKFGVSAKEKLRNLKVNVDTLTLTATPIPRTLQFSLMGARDLSVINTPPPNRHPIVTELHTFNEGIIQEGIHFEVSRGGQVFFIHNRVENIYEVEAMIRQLCPRVNTAVAHGQMDGPSLEKTMIEFINGDHDVLVSTTIIESGLDIPNVNTIFIHNSQNFGLSDLHQLRGRVGRSNKRAFCYLIAPPLVSLTPEARRRLKAIEDSSDLGSGFNIALQDLDIRGAGNMLGAEQSGFIADIGFDAYNRILNEAIQELKENEFRAVFQDDQHKEKSAEIPREEIRYVSDCIVETDLELHIPDEYVGNISERLKLYRSLDSVKDERSLEDFAAGLADRFGAIPPAVSGLFQIVRLRWLAEFLGFEKLIFRNGQLVVYFISNQNAKYYSSPTFANILKYVQSHPELFKLKEGKEKLMLIIDSADSLNKVYDLLRKMREATR